MVRILSEWEHYLFAFYQPVVGKANIMADFMQNPEVSFSISNTIEKVGELIKTALSYFALPFALPLIFIQECVAWFRQRTGLGDRSLEGKVCFRK